MLCSCVYSSVSCGLLLHRFYSQLSWCCWWIIYGTNYSHASTDVTWDRCSSFSVSCEDKDSSVWQNLEDKTFSKLWFIILLLEQISKIKPTPSEFAQTPQNVFNNTTSCGFVSATWLAAAVVGNSSASQFPQDAVARWRRHRRRRLLGQEVWGWSKEVRQRRAASSIVRWPREETASSCRPERNFPRAEASLRRCLGHATRRGLTVVFAQQCLWCQSEKQTGQQKTSVWPQMLQRPRRCRPSTGNRHYRGTSAKCCVLLSFFMYSKELQ